MIKARHSLPLAAGALALALLAGPTLASSDRGDDRDDAVPAADWLSIGELTQRLEANGGRVTKVEADDGVYEVYIMEDGVRYEMKVHPRTAEILHRERD
ncbi:PepSY domain-containing protein [Salinarimonas rosea]|uniref:PepSY domain-containing protein n=1 Tax=Salinarimonas rosea TaxID=552063 RepID=UPI00041A17AD|nr:PepSY domain-containing protein [Salinarimonas rosea]